MIRFLPFGVLLWCGVVSLGRITTTSALILDPLLLNKAAKVRRQWEYMGNRRGLPVPQDLYYPSVFLQPEVRRRGRRSRRRRNDDDDDEDDVDDYKYRPETYRGFCNWILPGMLMVGQYPCPSPEPQSPSLEDCQRHLETVIRDGRIRLFVSLQSEIPPQTDFPSWKRNDGMMFLEGSGRRDFPSPFLHYAPLALGVSPNVDFWHAPIEDLSVPNSESLIDLLDDLLSAMGGSESRRSISYEDDYDDDYDDEDDDIDDEYDDDDDDDDDYYDRDRLRRRRRRSRYPRRRGGTRSRSKAVYVHCWGGRGRAGVIASCVLALVFPEVRDPDIILDLVQDGYDTREGGETMPRGLRRSPQTAEQRDFVRSFIDQVQRTVDYEYER